MSTTSTTPVLDETDTYDRIATPHGDACTHCEAYPVPTKGGLCHDCRLPVETFVDSCGCVLGLDR